MLEFKGTAVVNGSYLLLIHQGHSVRSLADSGMLTRAWKILISGVVTPVDPSAEGGQRGPVMRPQVVADVCPYFPDALLSPSVSVSADSRAGCFPSNQRIKIIGCGAKQYTA